MEIMSDTLPVCYLHLSVKGGVLQGLLRIVS